MLLKSMMKSWSSMMLVLVVMPLSMFLDENAVPFTGGTYFPPKELPGRPSFINVLENVCLPGYVSSSNFNEIKLKAEQLLVDLGLSDRLYHKPNHLSGGEQQRVAIARSLINSPDIVFADEPTGNLDSKNSKNFIEIIKKLNKKLNQTFVIVTHNKDFIKISDKSYKINKGKIS